MEATTLQTKISELNDSLKPYLFGRGDQAHAQALRTELAKLKERQKEINKEAKKTERAEKKSAKATKSDRSRSAGKLKIPAQSGGQKAIGGTLENGTQEKFVRGDATISGASESLGQGQISQAEIKSSQATTGISALQTPGQGEIIEGGVVTRITGGASESLGLGQIAQAEMKTAQAIINALQTPGHNEIVQSGVVTQTIGGASESLGLGRIAQPEITAQATVNALQTPSHKEIVQDGAVTQTIGGASESLGLGRIAQPEITAQATVNALQTPSHKEIVQDGAVAQTIGGASESLGLGRIAQPEITAQATVNALQTPGCKEIVQGGAAAQTIGGASESLGLGTIAQPEIKTAPATTGINVLQTTTAHQEIVQGGMVAQAAGGASESLGQGTSQSIGSVMHAKLPQGLKEGAINIQAGEHINEAAHKFQMKVDIQDPSHDDSQGHGGFNHFRRTKSVNVGQLHSYAHDMEDMIHIHQSKPTKPLGSSSSGLLVGPEHAAAQAHVADVSRLQRLTEQIGTNLNAQILDEGQRALTLAEEFGAGSFASRTMASSIQKAMMLTNGESPTFAHKNDGNLANGSQKPAAHGSSTQSLEGSFDMQSANDGFCAQPPLGSASELAVPRLSKVVQQPNTLNVRKADNDWQQMRRPSDSYIVPFEPAPFPTVHPQFIFPENDPYCTPSSNSPHMPDSVPQGVVNVEGFAMGNHPSGQADVGVGNSLSAATSNMAVDRQSCSNPSSRAPEASFYDGTDVLMSEDGAAHESLERVLADTSPFYSATPQGGDNITMADSTPNQPAEYKPTEPKIVRKARKEVDHFEFVLQNLRKSVALEEAKLSDLKSVAMGGQMTFDEARGAIEQQEREIELRRSDLAMATAEYKNANQNFLAVCDRAELDSLIPQIKGLKGILSGNPQYPFAVVAQIQEDIRTKATRVEQLQERLKLGDDELEEGDSEEESSEPSNTKGKGKMVSSKRARPDDTEQKAKKAPSKRVKQEATSGSQPPVGRSRADKAKITELGGIVSKWLEESANIDKPVSELCSLPMLSEDNVRFAEMEGKRQLEEFAQTGNPASVDPTIRKWCIHFPRYLPESAFSTREIAILVHTSGQSNTRCRHHAMHRNSKWKNIYDGNGANSVEGVSYPPNFGPSAQALPNHFHCGCPIDAVLLDFFIWKTTTATSYSQPGVVETMRQDVILPRIRAFVTSAFDTYTTLSVEDIFMGGQHSAYDIVDHIQMKLAYKIVRRLKGRGWQIDLVQDSNGKIEDEMEA